MGLLSGGLKHHEMKALYLWAHLRCHDNDGSIHGAKELLIINRINCLTPYTSSSSPSCSRYVPLTAEKRLRSEPTCLFVVSGSWQTAVVHS